MKHSQEEYWRPRFHVPFIIKCERAKRSDAFIFFIQKDGRRGKLRGYKLLTHDDRKTIERMYAAGAKPHLIAEAVGSTLATVYRELQRGATDVKDSDYRPTYSAEIAEERVRLNMSNRGRRRKTVT